MELLRKLILILQQHYEKLLLGLVVLALVLAGLLLAQQKQKEKDELEQYITGISKQRSVLYTNVDWSLFKSALAHGTNFVRVDFTKPRLHNLFGPVKWQRRPDGTLLKIELGTEVGPEALKVTKITPLYLTINMDKASGASGYFMSILWEGATNQMLRKKIQSYMTVGTKDRLGKFVLKEIKGAPEEPELVVELTDSGDKVSVFKDKPFQRVDGYKADLSYAPESKAFAEKRLSDSITLAGEDYILIAISQGEVVLSARSNNKRTTLRYNAAP